MSGAQSVKVLQFDRILCAWQISERATCCGDKLDCLIRATILPSEPVGDG